MQRFRTLVVAVLLPSLLATLAPRAVVATQPVPAETKQQELSRLLGKFPPDVLLRIDLQDARTLEGRLLAVRDSGFSLRATPGSTIDCSLNDVMRVQEQQRSHWRGRTIGAVVVGVGGVFLGLSAGVLTLTGPIDNSDLAVYGAVGGLVGMGVGALLGGVLDPGVPSGWRQRYPEDNRSLHNGPWDLDQ